MTGRADRRAGIRHWVQPSSLSLWGSNVPQTRTRTPTSLPKCTLQVGKTVAVTPDYAEVAKLSATTG